MHIFMQLISVIYKANEIKINYYIFSFYKEYAASKNLYKSTHYRVDKQNVSQAVLLTIHVLDFHQ